MDDFVLTKTEGGNIMAGGYIINDKLLIPSMTGGKNDDEESIKERKYAIPAGLFYVDVPYQESSVEMIYKNNSVLSDDIYDNLYDNVIITKSIPKKINEKKKNKNTKKRKKSTNSTNKKSRKQK